MHIRLVSTPVHSYRARTSPTGTQDEPDQEPRFFRGPFRGPLWRPISAGGLGLRVAVLRVHQAAASAPSTIAKITPSQINSGLMVTSSPTPATQPVVDLEGLALSLEGVG